MPVMMFGRSTSTSASRPFRGINVAVDNRWRSAVR
jgi:hypothetical protein